MFSVKTGRQRNITITVNPNAPIDSAIYWTDAFQAEGAVDRLDSTVSVSFANVTLRAKRYLMYDNETTYPAVTGWDYHHGVTYSVSIVGRPTVTVNEETSTGRVNAPHTVPYILRATDAIDAVGTIVVPVEEWADISDVAVSSTGKITASIRLYEKMRLNAYVTASFGGASDSWQIDSALEIGYGVAHNLGLYSTLPGTFTGTLACTFNGAAMSSPSPTISETYPGSVGGDVSQTLTVSSTLSVSVTGLGTGHNATSSWDTQSCGQIIATLYPLRQVQYEGIVSAWNQPYPNALTALVTGDPTVVAPNVYKEIGVSGGTWSHTLSQKQYSITFYYLDDRFQEIPGGNIGGSEPFNLNEWQPTSCKLQAASLQNAGEDGAADEAYIRGYRWTVGNFSQASSLQIAGSWTAKVENSHELPDKATAAGAQGTHPDFWGANKASLQGYRYLSIPLKHNNANPQTLTSVQIGSKTWSRDKDGNSLKVSNGSTYQEILLDLCNPDGTEETDVQDTRYPFNRVDTWAWGVTSASGIILNGIANGVTFTAEKAVLKRLGKTLLTVLPTYGNMVQKDTLPIATPWKYRCDFLVCNTDGKKSQEQSDVGQMPFDWSARSIGTIKDEIMNGTYPSDGFSMTANAPSANTNELAYYLSDIAPAWCLWGSGAWYDGTRDPGDEWQYAIDLNVTAGVSIPGQLLITEITDWMPDAGDAFEKKTGPGSAGYDGGALKLRAASFLRGQAAGLVFRAGGTSSKRSAWQGATVSVKESTGGADAGSGKSGSQGFYKTGMPYAKTAVSGGHMVELQSGAVRPSVAVTFVPRKRWRVSFRGTPICCDNLFCVPSYYFPFIPQFSDPNTLPSEDWRNFARSPQENQTDTANSETEGTSE